MKATHIKLKWAGGLHRFALDFTKRDSLQAVTAMTDTRLHDRVREMLGRLVEGRWGVEDITGPIRVGLIQGGDFKPSRDMLHPWKAVDDLVNQHVLSRPLAESVPLAQTVLLAAIVGVDPDLADAGLEPVQVTLGDALTAMKA